MVDHSEEWPGEESSSPRVSEVHLGSEPVPVSSICVQAPGAMVYLPEAICSPSDGPSP